MSLEMVTEVEERRGFPENGQVRPLELAEDFQGPGFRFVRSFLLLILLLVGLVIALAGFLSWYFSMVVTVEGQGIIEPRHRSMVKAPITGIIKEVHVHTGQSVEPGELLISLDDADWRAELNKIEADLEVNQSRIRALETQIEQERRLRKAEVVQAQREVSRVHIQLEQVVAEQRIYSQVNNLNTRLPRKPLEELLPVRMASALLVQSEGDLALAQQRLAAVDGRQQEIDILRKARQRLAEERALLQRKLEQSLIRATTGGTVLTSALHRRLGDHVQAGEAILEMAEIGEWQAKIMVKEMDIPKVEVGQSAHLYVNAFPHMEYKVFKGVVATVPATPTEASPAFGAVYSIKVSIQNPQVSDGVRVYSLAYGMNAEAKVIVERGRIVELLWKKLLRSTGKVGQHDFYFQEPEAKETLTELKTAL